jgi:uncharacterized protein
LFVPGPDCPQSDQPKADRRGREASDGSTVDRLYSLPVPTEPFDLGLLYVLVILAAVLYSSGGHAGASAYLAIMSWFALAPASMRPTALVMNMAVAAIGTARFSKARAVPFGLLLPLCAGSLPMAYLGGRIRLPPSLYTLLLSIVLLVAAAFLWLRPRGQGTSAPPRRELLILLGAGLGFVAGLTGIGGGIFLSPILILTGWEDPRRTSGAAAVFILLNSALGLLGQMASTVEIPTQAGLLAAAAAGGGLLGSWLGAYRLQPLALRRVHAVVLVVSGAKLLYEGVRGMIS